MRLTFHARPPLLGLDPLVPLDAGGADLRLREVPPELHAAPAAVPDRPVDRDHLAERVPVGLEVGFRWRLFGRWTTNP